MTQVRPAWGKVVKNEVPASLNLIMQQEKQIQQDKKQQTEDYLLALTLQDQLIEQELPQQDEFEAFLDSSSSQSSSSSSSSQSNGLQINDPDLELALKLQAEFDALNGIDSTVAPLKEIESENDELVALQLQAQFDGEYNRYLSAYEKQKNAGSKIQVSYQKYKFDGYGDDNVNDFEDFDDDIDDFATSQGQKNKKEAMNKSNQKTGNKKEIITKHDITLNSLKNAKRLESHPTLNVGNLSSIKELRIPYKVYNSLQNRAAQGLGKDKNKTRLFDKDDFSTSESVLDKRTRLILLNMINSGVLESIEGLISSGKEANVYYGIYIDKDEDYEDIDPSSEDESTPKTKNIKVKTEEENDDEEVEKENEEDETIEAAIKIFRTTLNEFKNREEYIRDDHRFQSKLSKHNPRKLIRLWAEKEMCNLKRLNSAGVPSPQVLFYSQHVLVMSFIGEGKQPAPKLKEVGKHLSMRKREDLYQQCVQSMRKMYQDARLIHADLSEYNMLYFENKLWFIDVSQAVEAIHPNAKLFLFRDCCNVTRFFKDLGVEKMFSETELFFYITMEAVNATNEVQLLKDIQQSLHEILGENVTVSLNDPNLHRTLEKIVPNVWNQELDEENIQTEDDEDGDKDEDENLDE